VLWLAACAGGSPLLWTSPPLTTSWTSYCVTLHPTQSTASLTFEAASSGTSGAPQELLLDHIVSAAGCP
jgi:hypothetical protein